MARIRSVHPGLFTDESFMSATPLARIVMIGLWTEADDNGVFEWKPLTLKARLLPADNADMAAMLDELAALNIICGFEHGVRSFGAIRNFRKYQRPKKPNAVHPLPSKIAVYVGLDDDGSPSVGNQFGTDGENPPQMEDGGWRMEDGPSVPSSDGTEGSARRAPTFADFWNGIPKDSNASEPKAKQAWGKLSEEDKALALQSLPAFAAYCRERPTYTPCHPWKYLVEKRFLGHAQTNRPDAPSLVKISPGSPEWDAWLEHKRRIGERTSFMESQGREGKGFPVPTRFPPHAGAA